MKKAEDQKKSLAGSVAEAFAEMGNDFMEMGRILFEKLFRRIFEIWQVLLMIAIILIIDYIGCYEYFWNYQFRIYWMLRNGIFVFVILYITIMTKRLSTGIEALAEGDLNYQVDTHSMYWGFRYWGEDINSIAEGMNCAVEQRIKSERMKTELITNVSHDIKTPLTSIINYANLIGEEKCENEKITEYSEVLVRQSERLKRLIEDLVEASKAATGNLEVVLQPCEAEILLTQAAGEFEQKLFDAGLELKISQPETPVKIMADSRRLWRVFDNLMNNICKYAQRGTRVYLSLEEKEGRAVFTFKNTSHAALNVSAEELIERFVRGDASRSTDGNGLGLSIAKSLTELQNGTFELSIDGDLFKVILEFPQIE